MRIDSEVTGVLRLPLFSYSRVLYVTVGCSVSVLVGANGSAVEHMLCSMRRDVVGDNYTLFRQCDIYGDNECALIVLLDAVRDTQMRGRRCVGVHTSVSEEGGDDEIVMCWSDSA